MFPAAAASTFLPVAVEPVNDTRSTIFDSVSACPAGPAPETMFTTPSGTPASATSFMISHALELVNSLGLTTTVQPAASANGSFWHRISAGKFHGMIRPTTPTGSRSTIPVKSLPLLVNVLPCMFSASEAAYRHSDAAPPMSPSARMIGLPPSSLSSRASLAASRSIRSASRFRMMARSMPLVCGQVPVSNAVRATVMACSTASTLVATTWLTTSSVPGARRSMSSAPADST